MGSPPRILEKIVELLLPPRQREHVLGDLHERYRHPAQYLTEAVCALPCVVFSQLRRTFDPGRLLIEALLIYASLLAGAWLAGGGPVLYEQTGLFRLAIPAAAALIGLLLCNAYAPEGGRTARRAVFDAAAALAMAWLCESVLDTVRPEGAVPRSILLPGIVAALFLLSGVRTFFLRRAAPPPHVTNLQGRSE